LEPSVKEGYEGILVVVPIHQLSLFLLFLILIRMLLSAVTDEKQEDGGEGKKRTYAI
jgi:uncharacterized membrane protein